MTRLFLNQKSRTDYRDAVLALNPSIFLHDVLDEDTWSNIGTAGGGGGDFSSQGDGAVGDTTQNFVSFAGDQSDYFQAATTPGTPLVPSATWVGETIIMFVRFTETGSRYLLHVRDADNIPRWSFRISAADKFESKRLFWTFPPANEASLGFQFPVGAGDGKMISSQVAMTGIRDGNWHMIGWSFNGRAETWRLFFDWVQIDAHLQGGNGVGMFGTVTDKMKIGFAPLPDDEVTSVGWGTSNPFKGDIAEVAMWGDFLTPAQIAALQLAGDFDTKIVENSVATSSLTGRFR